MCYECTMELKTKNTKKEKKNYLALVQNFLDVVF